MEEQQKKPESEAVRIARERFEALRAQSNKPDPERVELADYARKESAERERLDAEGKAALEVEASIAESEAWAKMDPAKRAGASVLCVYDYATHKRTGRGIMIVTSLGRDAAVLSLKNSNKMNGGIELYDGSEPAVLRDLLDATLYPDSSTVQAICNESPMLAASVHAQVMSISGMAAQVTAGKSGS